MKKIILGLGLVLLWVPFISKADSAVIYISQVQTTNGSGKTTEDFIELFNPNSQPFNLNGYRLVKRTSAGTTDTAIKSWTQDEFIPAYSFYLWANSNFVSISSSPDATTTGSISDDNGVAIRNGPNDTGTIVDSLAWGSANNSFNNPGLVNPGAGQAIVRQDLFSSTFTYSLAVSNPRNSSISQPAPVVTPPAPTSTSTPTTTSTPPQVFQSGGGQPIFSKSGLVTISEFLPNPPGEDDGQEKVELQNSGLDIISLTGWMLDDKSDGGGPKPRAYTLSGTIVPGQFLVITLPKGSFALNNTGGDVLNLYYPDKTLADSVSYTDSAPENLSYQKIGSSWVWATPTLGLPNVQQTQTQQPATTYKVSISEFMPNPDGQDEGKEWVELYNSGEVAVNLKGFILDDSGSGAPGSSSFILPDNLTIPSLGYLQIIIPEGNFTLGNSGDSLRLFDPNKNLIETESYKDAPEGQSYFKGQDGKWQFGLPTPGQPNFISAAPFNLIISEILPNPNQSQDEFVEIYNPTDSGVSLDKFTLLIGDKKKVFDANAQISAKGFYVIYEDDLPARLRNSGQVVVLDDLYGRQVAQVKYPVAPSGQSYATEDGKNYVWTESVTPELANQMVLGAETTAEVSGNKKTTASTKTTTAEITKTQAKELLASNEDLKQQLAVLQDSVNQLDQKLSALQSSPSSNLNASKPDPISTNKKPLSELLVFPVAVALAGGVVVYAFKQRRNKI